MKKLLPLKNDFVFKKLFSTDTEILTDLINCVLKLPDKEKIVSVEIKNPIILADEIDRKYIILDIRAKDESGREYDIEMQVRHYEHYVQRTLYYLCRMYGDQLESGGNYAKLHPVIGIHFLDYEQFPEHDDDFHYHFYLKDTRYPELSLTDDLSLHIFELPGIEPHITGAQKDSLIEWLHFFNHAHEEKEETMQEHYANPMIHKAFHGLTTLSADDIARDLAERREKALKDEAMFLEEAMNKGLKKGMKQVAKFLLEMGDPLDKIGKATGLTVEEIRQLGQDPVKLQS